MRKTPFTVLGLYAAFQSSAFAFPKSKVPDNADDSDLIASIVAYVKLGLTLALIIAGVLFVLFVGYQLINAFMEWRDNKIESGKFLGSVGGGGILLAITIYLLYYAATYWLPSVTV